MAHIWRDIVTASAVWYSVHHILNPHQFSYTPVIEPLLDLMMFLDEVKKKLPVKEGNISDFNTRIRSLLSQPVIVDWNLLWKLSICSYKYAVWSLFYYKTPLVIAIHI